MIPLFLLLASSCAPTHVDWFGNEQNELGNQLVLVPEEIDMGDQGDIDEDSIEVENSEQDETTVVPVPRSKPGKKPVRPNNGKNNSALEELNRKILLNAEYVFQKERKVPGIGNACNFFIQRILKLTGFSKKGYLAHDFDLYAADAFTSHQMSSYQAESTARDEKKLDQLLKSYPEGTPFILQWERNTKHGHLALIHRVQESFVIYDASLGRTEARKARTTPRILLSGYGQGKLNVFVGFMPSGK